MQNGILLVISGPAGSGKGQVTKQLIANGEYAFSVSATTRLPRPGETNGVDYWYISREEFEKRIREGEMLEYTEYCGNYYGTPKKEAMDVIRSGKNLILEIEVEGGQNVKKAFPEAVLVMLLPPSAEIQEKRLRGRATETEEKILARLQRAHEELALLDKYDYVVYNYDNQIEQCAQDILTIVKAEGMKTSRQPDTSNKYFNKGGK